MLCWPQCLGPSFAGALNVNVAGQSTLDPFPYDYHTVTSHTVVSVVPLSGPVAGGTGVTILGSKLTTNATVMFVEQDLSGSATGMKAECTWRRLFDMGSADAMIRQVQVGGMEGGGPGGVASSRLPTRVAHHWRHMSWCHLNSMYLHFCIPCSAA
jgi:hypothetical protein